MKKKILFTLCSTFILGLAGCDIFTHDIIVLEEINGSENINSNTQVDISPVSPAECAHEFVEMESEDAYLAPTCDTSGHRWFKCLLCGEFKSEIIAPIGHLFGYSNSRHPDDVAPTCTEKGVEHVSCTREGCDYVEARELEPLGHDFASIPVLQDDYITMIDSKCTNHSCNEEILYWDARYVTDECRNNVRMVEDPNGGEPYSEPNYVENEDGSVSFYGRPIHNAMEIDKTGVYENGRQLVYDENVVGSFIEYKINLPEARNNVNLVADIKANEYHTIAQMFSNLSDDWTPGLKKIKNGDQQSIIYYPNRYIVTIDGVELEQDLSGPYNVTPTRNKRRYTFPLADTLNLSEGEHIIRITMAGGFIASIYTIGLMNK